MKLPSLLLLLFFYSSRSFSQYNYLGPYTADGTPLYFATSDVVTTQTLSLIRSALPERYPVPQYNPQYISSGYDTDIRLKDSAEVWVTFVDEGAGYKNVLGFYTYNLNAPLTTRPPDGSITIIFPNVSKLNSGGSLLAGNKVKLGNFSPNTGIGFVLIADGWRNGAVSNGNWKVYSNPSFNPETNASLRYHNVLISDSTNQRLILGFEDIRRDYSSCDNDFNDALFYVTASPYTAIETSNYVPIEASNTATSSGNEGGLESNGKLSALIAKRNFDKEKNGNYKDAQQKTQETFAHYLNNPNVSNRTNANLQNYFAATGMFGTEQSFISTPTDLLSITNARDIFSIDYYEGSQRVSASLASYTEGQVYDHSKTICDRLNGSSLEDVRTIILNDFKLINATLLRPNGEIEYAVAFSVKVNPAEYQLYSLWNIEQYPAGNYLNFQVWGKTMGQVCSIVNKILEQLQLELPVTASPSLTVIPDLYIRKGSYQNGKLKLSVTNKAGITSAIFTSNKSVTETSGLSPFNTSIQLNGQRYQDVEVNTGYLFDIGFSLGYTNCPQQDGIYLADGVWASAYANEAAKEVTLTVNSAVPDVDNNKLAFERNAVLNAKIKGDLSLFRTAKGGNGSIDISTYETLSFDIKSNKPVEVVLVPDSLQSWQERVRYTIKPKAEITTIHIPISRFYNKEGNPVRINKIKTIVFTVSGNAQEYSPVNIEVKNLYFDKTYMADFSSLTSAIAYPNPAQQNTTLVFPPEAKSGMLTVIDENGKTMVINQIATNSGSYSLNVVGFRPGIYFFALKTIDNKKFGGKFVVSN